jgi:hypothetical protein
MLQEFSQTAATGQDHSKPDQAHQAKYAAAYPGVFFRMRSIDVKS